MTKKCFLSVALSMTLLAGYSAPAAVPETQDPTEQVATLPDGQVELATDVESGEVNTVEESAIAQKMTKEEKAENAKENDSWGGAITIIAMGIVLAALIILSILFLGFGKISSRLLSKKKLEAHGKTKEDVDDDHEDVDSGEAIAAIALALAEHFNTQHDIEDTIITIRRMKKAYSPWNSKIYNLRETPQLKRNPAPRIVGTNKNL